LPAVGVHHALQRRRANLELVARQPVLVPDIGADDDGGLDSLHHPPRAATAKLMWRPLKLKSSPRKRGPITSESGIRATRAKIQLRCSWVPAFAGTTVAGVSVRISITRPGCRALPSARRGRARQRV